MRTIDNTAADLTQRMMVYIMINRCRLFLLPLHLLSQGMCIRLYAQKNSTKVLFLWLFCKLGGGVLCYYSGQRCCSIVS